MDSSQLFPKLNSDQLDILKDFGEEKEFTKGDVLISEGDKQFSLYAILEGSIDIHDPFDQGRIIVNHGPGEFTGDSDMISDRSSLFKAVANENLRAIEIPPDKLKRIISENSGLSDVLLQSFLLRRAYELDNQTGGFKLIGSRYSPETFKLREFLSRNHLRYVWIDLEDDQRSKELIDQFDIQPEETPIIINGNKEVFKNPTIEQIAACTGVATDLKQDQYDLIVVGAGPAGLAASVYAASEGLNVITIDEIAPGGQAGTSSKIENYLGFPSGISGRDLANRAYLQAQKFGCTISIPFKAESLSFQENVFRLKLTDGQEIYGSTVIGATGAQYKRLPIDNIRSYEGKGIYYGATHMESRSCQNQPVLVIGGGNSAGQAAMFLADHASEVHLMIRGNSLDNTMSSYLIRRIQEQKNIQLHLRQEVVALKGEDSLQQVVVRNNDNGEEQSWNINHLFLFIGAAPNGQWLNGLVCTDDKGFIYTGKDLDVQKLRNYSWSLARDPYTHETCTPGLFVVGDLRSGSTKRVASAVGEGAIAVSQVHSVLS